MQIGKKSLSLLLVLVMLFTTLCFFPLDFDVVVEAKAAEVFYTYNEKILSGLTGSTTINSVSGKYFSDDNNSNVTEANLNAIYHNVAYSSMAQRVANTSGKIRDDGALQSFDVYYPTTVLMYDGSGNPTFGVSIRRDAKDASGTCAACKIMHCGTSITAQNLSFVNSSWWGHAGGSDNGKLLDSYVMENHSCGLTYTGEYNSGNYYEGDAGAYYWHMNIIQYTGSLTDTYSATITPSFSTTFKQPSHDDIVTFGPLTASIPVYVIKTDTLEKAYSEIDNLVDEIKANPTKYKSSSVEKFVELANALTAVNPNAINWEADTATAVANYAKDAKDAVDKWNTWYNAGGLELTTLEISYENFYDFNVWRHAGITGSNVIVSDVTSIGFKITSNNPNDNDSYTLFSNKTKLAPGKYVLYADIEASQSSYGVFIAYYDAADAGVWDFKAIESKAFGVEQKKLAYEFTITEANPYVAFRFDSDNYGNSVTIRNIRIAKPEFAPYDVEVGYNEKFADITANIPEISGYTFNGWLWGDKLAYDGTGKWVLEGKPNYTVAEYSNEYNSYLLPLISQWTENQYNVAFNANTGSGSMATLSKKYTDVFTLTKNTFTKVGHNFVGWNTKADGSGTAYADMASVSKLASENNATVTLYAQWKPIKYTITWLNHDDTILGTTQAAYGTTPVYNGETPVREGDAQYSYTFTGWYPTVVNVTGPTTYKAQFTPKINTYTVTWVNEDGTVLEIDENVSYGTTPVYNGATPEKAPTAEFSYVHSGWNPTVSFITGDVTYTATYTETRNSYTVTWKNEDGTVLGTEKVPYGTVPVYKGETPTKAPDAEFTYTHSGWDPEVVAVTGEATYTATYSTETNTYTVTWKNENGTVLETDTDVSYGATPVYNGETPTKAADAQYTYTHSGWTPEITTVKGDVTYTATFSSTVNEYTITWVDGNGKTLKTEQVAYGETPAYTGDTPTKAATAQYSYTFNNSWSPAIAAVTGNATYTAQFTSTVNTYTITWLNGDGTTLKTEELAYGAMPGYIGSIPSKARDEQYSYSFQGWSPSIVSVTGDATYTPVFTGTLRTYTVTWQNEDGTVLDTDTVEYGTVPTYAGDTPTKASDTENTYTFAGWTDEVVAVTGNVTYTAKYDSAPRKYTITWVNYDGTTLYSEDVAYGAVPVYTGATPEKDADAQYTYTHSGWTPEVAAVTGDATYTATYTETFNKYTVTFKYFDGTTVEREYIYGTLAGAIEKPENTVSSHDEVQHYSYSWPALSDVTGDVTYEETVKETAHNFIKGELTRPVFTDGVWSDGYYTYTCNVDGDTHTKTEPVKRADYTEYTEALNKLEELLGEEILENTNKDEIRSIIETNKKADNLIVSEQNELSTAAEIFRNAFEKYSQYLKTYTVTFKVGEDTVKTETVVVNKNATAPADPAGYYEDDYHYTFAGWDKDFTNVQDNITVNAKFDSALHEFTIHTDKDDTYHTDKCECGYTKDVEHSYNDGEITTKPTCTHTGIKTFTCSVCEGTKTETVDIDPDAHKEAEEYIQTVAPTCTEKGKATYNCVYCGEELRTIDLDIIEDAHKWETEYTVDEKASCEKAGSKSYHCEYCDIINEESVVVIPMRAHELRDTTVELAATCITKGIMNQECVNKASDEYEACEYTTTREIEINPDNHDTDATYVDGYRAPTCTVPGATGATKHECCHAVISESTVIPVDADAHTGTADVIKNYEAATCNKEGYSGDIYWSCCDKLSENGQVIEKTAHTEGEVVIENKVPATATENGSYDEVIYCTVCGEEISRVKKTYSAQDVLPGLPENGKVVINIDEDGNSTESLDDILGADAEYKSDDVTVDEDGNITATEDGEAVITVTTPDGEEIDITVTVRTLKTIIFVMKDETVTVKAYKGDRLTAPTVNDFIEDGFTYTFKSWSPAITVVTEDITYTAIYTEPCDYDEFDRLSGLFDEIVNGGKVDEAVLESNKEIIDTLLADIAAINEVRNTRDKSEQAIIDDVVERLDEIVLRIYPDAGSTLEIFGAATYYVGTVMDLRVMKMPLGTVVSDVEWSSSDEDVVFFADGKLYAFGTGTATLTATKGLVKATKTVTVVAGGNTRSINFTSVDLTVNFFMEGYKQLYDSTLLYWSDDTALRFRINVYMNPVFRDYVVYANGVEIEMDENSYYVIPAGSGDVQIVVAGELYENEEEENKEPVTKWSLWDWILDFFRKIGDFFRNLFS